VRCSCSAHCALSVWGWRTQGLHGWHELAQEEEEEHPAHASVAWPKLMKHLLGAQPSTSESRDKNTRDLDEVELSQAPQEAVHPDPPTMAQQSAGVAERPPGVSSPIRSSLKKRVKEVENEVSAATTRDLPARVSLLSSVEEVSEAGKAARNSRSLQFSSSTKNMLAALVPQRARKPAESESWENDGQMQPKEEEEEEESSQPKNPYAPRAIAPEMQDALLSLQNKGQPW
jgi:hypothetical protein